MDRRYAKRMARYWQHQESYCLAALASLNTQAWFDHWQAHPDLKGRGNKHPENREAAARLVCSVLTHAGRLLADRPEPVQCWATLCEDTAQHAVFIHSANPNGTPFPHEFAGVEWDVAGEEWLAALIDLAAFRIGRLQHEGQTALIIVPKASNSGAPQRA